MHTQQGGCVTLPVCVPLRTERRRTAQARGITAAALCWRTGERCITEWSIVYKAPLSLSRSLRGALLLLSARCYLPPSPRARCGGPKRDSGESDHIHIYLCVCVWVTVKCVTLDVWVPIWARDYVAMLNGGELRAILVLVYLVAYMIISESWKKTKKIVGYMSLWHPGELYAPASHAAIRYIYAHGIAQSTYRRARIRAWMSSRLWRWWWWGRKTGRTAWCVRSAQNRKVRRVVFIPARIVSFCCCWWCQKLRKRFEE